MKTQTTFTLTFILFIIFSCSLPASAVEHHDFLKCLDHEFRKSISKFVYTSQNSSYSSILRFSVQNLRFATQYTPKPQAIITPEHESQIPSVIRCAKANKLQIRTRSGGHDYEGISYVSQVPFVILDMINISEITVDVEQKTAWVQSGATVGELYYRIAEKSSTLGFPAGTCQTMGTGGHFGGGGYGTLVRKYGLSADNIIDARIVDVRGKILNRTEMGEDLFWAIRGGGGASFGVILSWKVQLVDVPETVTVFRVPRTLEQNTTQLIHRWQSIAPKFDQDLFMRVILVRTNLNPPQNGRNMTILSVFNAMFLGGVDRLFPLMQESFPELGLVRGDCREMSWIQSVLYFGVIPSTQGLLNRTQQYVRYFKGKSDYVQKPIPVSGLEGIWQLFYNFTQETDAQAVIVMSPYGGRMDEISESALPFPHRAGNLYMFEYLAYWIESVAQNSGSYIDWTRRLYDYMALYVSNSPRSAYMNFRDLDIGVNNNVGKISYETASTWGIKYFKNNFDKLTRVKTMVDPKNFFRNEQSIPSSK